MSGDSCARGRSRTVAHPTQPASGSCRSDAAAASHRRAALPDRGERRVSRQTLPKKTKFKRSAMIGM